MTFDGKVQDILTKPAPKARGQLTHAGVVRAPGRYGRVAVVIPVLNEAEALPHVLGGIPDWVTVVAIGDNGSTDGSGDIAGALGALVVREPRRGYGSACLAAIAALPPVDIVVFLDGDKSDDASEMSDLVEPIFTGSADFVLGSRTMGERESGSLTPQQIFGNWLACTLIRVVWRQRFTDLGPFRAIRWSSLEALRMSDPDYGWTVEMQVRAAKINLRTRELPVRYLRRIGQSKVSSTLRGVIGAGTKILYVIGREALTPRRIVER
jgi:glycosyltransferase involved in cell wall biosynthesis